MHCLKILTYKTLFFVENVILFFFSLPPSSELVLLDDFAEQAGE